MQGGVFNLAFSPSGQQLASVSDDRAVFIWNLEDGSCRKMWGHEGRIWRVSWINEVQVVSVAEVRFPRSPKDHSDLAAKRRT